MRSAMFGFYPLSETEMQALWAEAIFVFDTNLILDFYRIPEKTREEYFLLMEKIQQRVWIPYQVAVEYQRNRTSVIADSKQQLQSFLTGSQSAFASLKTIISDIDLEKRNLDLNLDPILADIGQIQEKIKTAFEAVHQAQLEVSSVDPIRDRIDRIFTDRVGAGPTDQKALNELVADGEERFRNNIPPGFSDAVKSKKPEDACFIFNGMKYERQFGDLLIWKQIMEHALQISSKKVIIITRDSKSDWWWREHGRTLGPHPELIFEFQRKVPGGMVWIYSTTQFLEHAQRILEIDISQEAMDNVASVARSALNEVSTDAVSLIEVSGNAGSDSIPLPLRSGAYTSRYYLAERIVAKWLMRLGHLVQHTNSRFFDYLVKVGSEKIGVEVKHADSISNFVARGSLRRVVVRGKDAIDEGLIDVFYLIIVVESGSFELRDLLEAQFKLHDLLGPFDKIEFVIGSIEKNEFKEILRTPERSQTQLFHLN